jgi:acetate kinase
MRDVWAAIKRGNKKAKLALEWYCYRIAKYIGSFAAALGGLDCIVFTGGIGENAGYVRKMILDHLAFLKGKKVLVIKTDEARKIAEETAKLF